MDHFKAAAKIIFLSDVTCDNAHVLVRCKNYDDSDTLTGPQADLQGIQAGSCFANI